MTASARIPCCTTRWLLQALLRRPCGQVGHHCFCMGTIKDISLSDAWQIGGATVTPIQCCKIQPNPSLQKLLHCKYVDVTAFMRPRYAHHLLGLAARTRTHKSLSLGPTCCHFVPPEATLCLRLQCLGKARRCTRPWIQSVGNTLYSGVRDVNDVLSVQYSANLRECFPRITVGIKLTMMAILLNRTVLRTR